MVNSIIIIRRRKKTQRSENLSKFEARFYDELTRQARKVYTDSRLLTIRAISRHVERVAADTGPIKMMVLCILHQVIR